MDLPNDGFGRRVMMLPKADPTHWDVYAVCHEDGRPMFLRSWPAGEKRVEDVYKDLHDHKHNTPPTHVEVTYAGGEVVMMDPADVGKITKPHLAREVYADPKPVDMDKAQECCNEVMKGAVEKADMMPAVLSKL